MKKSMQSSRFRKFGNLFIWSFLFFLGSDPTSATPNKGVPPTQDQHPPQTPQSENKKAFLEKLLKQMTVLEKVGQLSQFSSDMDKTGPSLNPGYIKYIEEGKVGSVFNAYTPEFTHKLQDIALRSRLKIPLLFAYDVIHGHRTIFPIPLAESATWDLPLLAESARIAARESAADGLHWTFSPMVDISRDPRWGRVAEGAGEDPFLGSEIAKAKVLGYQGGEPANWLPQLSATLINFSLPRLTKNPPKFANAPIDATGAIDLQAPPQNRFPLQRFDDPESIMATVKHFALYGAALGGRDYNTVDMSRRSMFEIYFPPYESAVRSGAATVMTSFNDVEGVPSTANTWLLNDILRGLWHFQGFVVTDYTSIHELIHHGIAEDGKQASSLALKAGVDMDMQGGDYLQHLPVLLKENKITMKQLDQAVYRILSVKYDLGLFKDPYRGASREKADRVLLNPEHLEKAREIAQKSIVLLKNENNILPLGKGLRIAMIGPFVKNQRDLIGSWSAAGDWKRAHSLWNAMEAKASQFGWTLKYAKGANITDDKDLLKRLNEHGGLIEIDPQPPATLIENAVRLASESDLILAALGESQGMSGEAASRSDIGLPSNQQDLLRALVATGKPVVLILMNGRPLTLSWEQQNMKAIVETWFLGLEAGPAITSVLSGEFNPSGRLPVSFPRHVGQIPIFYAGKNTGRPFDPNNKYTSKYLDLPNSPLYPFGYGLSYTTFNYSEIKLNKTLHQGEEPLVAEILVTNTGTRAGDEVVQMYIRDLVASVTRPVMELKGFQKVHLHPGESKKINFYIRKDQLKIWDQNLNKVFEPGDFNVFIGPDSIHLKQKAFRWN